MNWCTCHEQVKRIDTIHMSCWYWTWSTGVFYFIYFWDRRQQSQCQMHKRKSTCALTEGRRDPSDARHCQVKKTKQKTKPWQSTGPTKPRITPTSLAKDNPQTTKAPSIEGWTTYLRCHFQFHPICGLFLLQRTFLSPHGLSKPWSMAVAEKLLILICLITCSHAALA